MVSAASAQQQQQRPTNLKVFPKDIPTRALRDTMNTFTRALGVRCEFCHVQREGETFQTMNFALDDNPMKDKAREMIRMTMAINNDLLSKVPDRDPSIGVNCMTCHHGVTEPRPLQQILLSAYQAAGADSAEKAYRNLRQRYYGRAAYDFGEVPLVDVANEVTRAGKRADAVRLHTLNVEFLPNSGFAQREAASAQLAVGDTAKAVALLQRALAINANDQQAQRLLQSINRR